MLDINYIEKNFQNVCKALSKRNKNYDNELKYIVDLNLKRKKIILEVEKFKAEKNKLSDQIKIYTKNNDKEKIEITRLKVLKLNKDIEILDQNLKNFNDEINYKLSFIPNIPNDNIPLGEDENNNVEIRRWNCENLKNHKLAHWDIAIKLKLVDFEMGTKLSGSRFLTYTGKGSKIIRAIIDVLLNRHIDNGYTEMWLPLIVNQEILYNTGQLPKFEEDVYRVGDQYLIPTAEVPLTNVAKGKLYSYDDLPIYLTGFTQCFRQEAGSAGRDTKGMIRLHQFNKVEMVKITNQESSYEELEKMVKDAEDCLKLFNIPYRVIELCGGDIGFSSAKTYDLEVWFPNQNKFREISSCSNCLDFQSRRMNAKYKNINGKNELVHTLNGSGVAIDRLFATILENYYDGEKLIIPEVLRPYFNNEKHIV